MGPRARGHPGNDRAPGAYPGDRQRRTR
jgi:hypothetical protein